MTYRARVEDGQHDVFAALGWLELIISHVVEAVWRKVGVGNKVVVGARVRVGPASLIPLASVLREKKREKEQDAENKIWTSDEGVDGSKDVGCVEKESNET